MNQFKHLLGWRHQLFAVDVSFFCLVANVSRFYYIPRFHLDRPDLRLETYSRDSFDILLATCGVTEKLSFSSL